MKYVSVILPLALNRVLTYAVPDELAADVIVGGRVVVPVGKKKLYTGIVSQIFDDFDLCILPYCLGWRKESGKTTGP